jgi:N-acetylglucosamine kinase-like BadF-type ATPase
MPGLFLGVDGGGTKTDFVLVARDGRILARHPGPGSYYLQTGIDGLNRILADGVHACLAAAGRSVADLTYAFFGLPAHGEDSSVQPLLDVLPEAVLGHRRYACGNDMICGWAGSLAGGDGINIVAGTGSIGYGERKGCAARAGGWGEVFSDEGSAYWIAIQGLNAFSRMSDGRLQRGPLYDLVHTHFGLAADLDLCGKVMGDDSPLRDELAALSRLVAQAAEAGDSAAREIFGRAALELADIVAAIRTALATPADEATRVSYSGGVFQCGALILEPLRRALPPHCQLITPILPPGIGAALYAARLAGEPLDSRAIDQLQSAI